MQAQQIIDPTMKNCPFCGQTTLLKARVGYPKGEDDGYKVICACGWAGRSVHGWYANKGKLIEKFNGLILDEEIVKEEASS